MRWLFILSFLLQACVGGTLSNTKDMEDYPLREADKNEGQRLKRCLHSAHQAQVAHKKKTGAYYSRTKDMPIEDDCGDFSMSQSINNTGDQYEIVAQFNEGESTVRWSINQDGIIEEHLDAEYNDDWEL